MSFIQPTPTAPAAIPPQKLCVVFTDVIDSTDQWNTNESAMWESIEIHHRILRDRMAQYSGFEIKSLGDGFFIVFVDPRQALHFCLVVQRELAATQWPAAIVARRAIKDATEGRKMDRHPRGLMIRMGLHWAQPFRTIHDQVVMRADVYGVEICAAHRVQEQANGDEIAISDTFLRELMKKSRKGEDPTTVLTNEIRAALIYRECSIGRYDFRYIGRPAMKGISEPEDVSIVTYKRR